MPAKKAAAAISKPTYAVMVADSIKTLNDRTGSSMQAIVKQLQSQYKFDINKPALVKAIKKGVEAGDLVQIKASYKLNKKAPASKTKKVTTVIKKKPVAKSSTTRKVCYSTVSDFCEPQLFFWLWDHTRSLVLLALLGLLLSSFFADPNFFYTLFCFFIISLHSCLFVVIVFLSHHRHSPCAPL